MTKDTIIATFKCAVQGSDVTEKEFAIRRPTAAQQREADKTYNRAFADAIKSGSLLRLRLEEFMVAQGLWDEEKQIRATDIGREINSIERKLDAGGFELDKAVELALRARKLRNELRNLSSKRSSLDVNTAEGQADNARFNHLVSCCLVYNDTQEPVYRDLDDYINSSTTIEAVTGATKLAQAIYGIQDDYENGLFENKFLQDYGITDDKHRLVNADGHLVDDEGRLINEDGYYVLPDGSLCDVTGNLITSTGEYIVEHKPFTKNGEVCHPKRQPVVV